MIKPAGRGGSGVDAQSPRNAAIIASDFPDNFLTDRTLYCMPICFELEQQKLGADRRAPRVLPNATWIQRRSILGLSLCMSKFLMVLSIG